MQYPKATYHSARDSVRRLLGVLLLLLVGISAHAQIFDDTDDGDDRSAEGSFTVADSLKNDSLPPLKEVDILTEYFDLQALEEARDPRQEIGQSLDEVMYFNLLERLPGFHITLGQIGKPYKRYRYGLDQSWLETGISRNIYTGQEDIFLMDPEREIRYYDTRTPYVNVYYGQGGGDLSAIQVDVSQNISPWWNVTGYFRREKATGQLLNHITDHYNLYLSTNFRTKNNRYHLFVNGMFQELNDGINGGADPFNATTAAELATSFWDGTAQPVLLDGASLEKISRNLYARHFYDIIVDTVETPHRLLIFNSGKLDHFENEFGDEGLTGTSINEVGIFPVYPTITDTTTFFYERYRHNRLTYAEGAAYRFRTPRLETGHTVEVTNEIINFDKNTVDYRWTRLTREYKGDAAFRTTPFALEGNWDLLRTTSNFFGPETYMHGEASFSFPKEKVDFTYYKEINNLENEKSKDSVLVRQARRPFTIFASATRSNRNPTIQQTFGSPWFGTSTFEPNRGLDNQQAELLKAGFEVRAKDEKTQYGYYEGHRLKATAFRSVQRNKILFGPNMDIQQMPANASLEFLGVEGEARVRWRAWSLEGMVNYQVPTATGDTTLELYFTDNQPNFYARGGFYWEKHNLKIARAIRTGIEYHYQPFYFQPLFDPAFQQYYPQNTLPQAGFLFPTDYHRVDVFFSAQIKRAQVFARVYNVLDGVIVPGYFTTITYPMWARDFQVGITWSFFD